MLTTIAFMFLAALHLLGDDSKEAVPMCEIEAIKSRQQISQGELEIVREGNIYRPEETFDLSCTMHVWFDGLRLRSDEVRSLGPSGSEKTRLVRCIADREFISWDDIYGRTPNIGVSVTKFTDRNEAALAFRGKLPTDPRLIGTAPNAYYNLANYTFDTVLGCPLRQGGHVSDGELDGIPCVISECIQREASQTKIWIAPSMNFAVLQIDFRRGDVYSTISTKYSQHTDSSLWFPSAYEFKSYRGDKLIKHERARIRIISLNKPIEPQVFTLAGIGLRMGNEIRTTIGLEKRITYWDGTNEVADRLGVVRANAQQEGRWRFWLTVSSIVMVVFAFVLIAWRRLKH